MSDRVYDFEDDSDKNYVFQLLKSLSETSGTDLITYYCKEYNESKLKKLHSERAQARSIKSKQTQKKVTSGLDTLVDVLNQLEDTLRGVSFVIFIKDKFRLVLKLPDFLARNYYHCGKSFETTSLQTYTELTWGLLVLDTQEVTIGLLKNHHLRELQNFEVFIPGKMKAGGQSQMRFEETRKNLVYSHIDHVSERCNLLFPQNTIQKLLLGGVIPTVDIFYNRNTLRPDLRKILESPVSTVYTNAKGLEELIQKKKQLYERELETYFLEKKWYEDIVGEKEKYTRDQLDHLSNYEILEIYTADYSHQRLSYCKECRQLKLKDSCEHHLDPLSSGSKIFVFNNQSTWGQKFLKRYGTLYKIKLLPL